MGAVFVVVADVLGEQPFHMTFIERDDMVQQVPTAIQQVREVVTGEKPYRFLVHDRDSIYSSAFDSAVEAMGLSVLKTPFRAPQGVICGAYLDCEPWEMVEIMRRLPRMRYRMEYGVPPMMSSRMPGSGPTRPR